MKKVWMILLIIVVILGTISGLGWYYLYGAKNYDSIYEDRAAQGLITNPTSSLTRDEAIAQFDDSFVYYLLYSIKAYNLHEPPFKSETPKIEFYIDNTIYNAEIIKGEIKIAQGEIENEDIIIRTSTGEAVDMVIDRDYIQESSTTGNSAFEMIASEKKLFEKGYLDLYEELTGESLV